MWTLFRRAAAFDVLHFHTEPYHLPLGRRHHTPLVTTLHGRLDLPGLTELYRQFDDLPLVSISRAQCSQMREANWIAVVIRFGAAHARDRDCNRSRTAF